MAAAGYAGFETNYISLEAGFANPAPLRAEFAKRKIELIGLHAGAALHTPEQVTKAEALFAHVAAGEEGLAGAGQDGARDRGIGGDRLNRVEEALPHRLRQRVHGRIVDGDDGNAVFACE